MRRHARSACRWGRSSWPILSGLMCARTLDRYSVLATRSLARLNSCRAASSARKPAEGYYTWKDGKPQKSEEARYGNGELEKLGRELVEPLIQEAQRAVDEGVVESADLVDAGVIFGTGFAPFRGGPLHFKSNERAGSEALAAAE